MKKENSKRCVKEMHGRAQLHKTQEIPAPPSSAIQRYSVRQKSGERLVLSNLLLGRKTVGGGSGEHTR